MTVTLSCYFNLDRMDKGSTASRKLELRTWDSPYPFSLFSKGQVIKFIYQGNLMSTPC